jgi:DNA-directed RNA polymerase specialized sigma24 family protein
MNAAIAYGIDHQKQAVSYVHRRGVAYADAEDVVQEALLACWRQGEIKIEFASSYWYRVLLSKILDYGRRAKMDPERLSDDALLVPERPQHVPERRERLAEVARHIQTTPRRRAALVKLVRAQPLNVKERRALYHLRDHLRQRLQSNEVVSDV